MDEHHGFFADPRLWVAVAFVIFFVVFGRTIRKAAMAALDRRAATVRAELAEASRLRQEAEVLLANAKLQRDAAMAGAERLLYDAKVEADQVTARAAEETRASASRRERMALERIAAAEKQAVSDVRLAAASIATAAATHVIREEFDASADKMLQDHAIAGISASLARRTA